MNRNLLYGIIGVPIIAVAVLGYVLYQERQDRFSFNLGPGGLKIENK